MVTRANAAVRTFTLTVVYCFGWLLLIDAEQGSALTCVAADAAPLVSTVLAILPAATAAIRVRPVQAGIDFMTPT